MRCSDLDIFLDYARRMEFRNKDGAMLLPWSSPEEVFSAWQECSRGRPCDYTGISYSRLRGGSGIQWPCNDDAPDGTIRLYGNSIFPTDPDFCESYGHDLLTGATVGETAYRARTPAGRAFFKTAPVVPAPEEPDADFPFEFTTGRTAYHFHTRTKTRRSRPLNGAAPDIWVELSAADGLALGCAEGDVVEVRSRRGRLVAPVRLIGIRPGTVFAPFHYGYFDTPERYGPGSGEPRAANELTLTEWDPVSKQPGFKNAAVSVRRLRSGTGPAPAPTTTASRPVDAEAAPATVGGPEADAGEVFPTAPPTSVATLGGRS
jgi:anaerobic selenocysteine-containing dehydrogenase